MKVMIREEIFCDDRSLKQYLPARYTSLVGRNFYEQIVTLVCFPVDQTVITSKQVEKALKRIKDQNAVTLYFARCFTLEAIKMISENRGELFSLVEFPWTDEEYHKVHGGR